MVWSVSSDQWKAPLASDFALCALKIVPDRFYIIIAPSPQGKIRFSNYFSSQSQSEYLSLLERFYGLRHLNMLKSS